jgi:hypothetical protein
MSSRLTLLAVALLAGSSLQAQQRLRVDPDIRKGVVTLNPFAVFAEYFAGDVEFKAAPAVTIGAGGSVSSTNNFDGYGAIEAKVRYYPGEKALQGFSVAGTVGVASAKEENYDFTRDVLTRTRVSRPSIGTELSYQWILGPSARFVAVTGLGLKRFLGENKNVDPLSIPIVPTARINIGIAF